MNFSEKEIRKLKKKARMEEDKFKKTNDNNHLLKRDEHNDKANEIMRNININALNVQKKKNKKQKTDEQLMNEAIRQNRREKNNMLQKQKIEQTKKDEIKQKKMKTRMEITTKKKINQEEYEKHIVEKQNYENSEKEAQDEFIKKYIEEHPDCGQSKARKEYIRYHNKKVDFLGFKQGMIQFLISNGLSETEAEEHFINSIEKMKTEIE